MVPGSTLMYGSSLMLVTRMLRDSRIAAREAAAMPFPREETTPPVTKTYFAIYSARVGMEQFTRIYARANSALAILRRAAMYDSRLHHIRNRMRTSAYALVIFLVNAA